MTKLIFITVFVTFIAELIIAISIITKICKFDQLVNDLNMLIVTNKNNIRNTFSELHLLLGNFVNDILQLRKIIRDRRNYYFISFLKTGAAYCGIFTLRGKYKKAIIAYQLAKEIYEGFSET